MEEQVDSAGMSDTGERIGIFVDTYNLFNSGRMLYKKRVDYGRLMDFLADQRNVIVAIAYNVIKKERESGNFVNNHKFEEALRLFGFETKSFKLNNNRFYCEDLAVMMSLDIINWSKKLDTIVLVSGDRVYCEVIKRVKNLSIKTEICGFGKSIDRELKLLASEYLELETATIEADNKTLDVLIPFDQKSNFSRTVLEEVKTE